MDIYLELKDCCIQTAAKRCHEKLVKECFKAHSQKNSLEDIEARLDALSWVLEHGDFAHTRSACPALSGGHARVKLSVFQDHFKVAITLEGKTFPMKLK